MAICWAVSCDGEITQHPSGKHLPHSSHCLGGQQDCQVPSITLATRVMESANVISYLKKEKKHRLNQIKSDTAYFYHNIHCKLLEDFKTHLDSQD